MVPCRFGIIAGVGLIIIAVSLPVWAQSASLMYYAAQLGGGSVTALAGGLVGALVGGFSGGLISEAHNGAKLGLGLGASFGATWGVLQVASAYDVKGDPTLALLGALAGSFVSILFLPDSAYPQLLCQMDAKSIRFGASVVFKLLVNPVTLAALGATIGYNLGKKE